MSLIKIPSQQQGVFTDTFNNCDFTIPENAVYNVENSYVNFVCNITVSPNAFDDDVGQTTTKKTNSIVNVGLVHNTAALADRQELFNVSLIKHCRLETSTQGTILNHRYINVLSNNLKYYEQSRGEIKSLNYERAGLNFADNKTDPQSLFVRKQKEGTNASEVMRDVVLKVPLKDLRGVMEGGVLPTDKLGRCVLGLELQPSIFKAVDLAQYNLPWLIIPWIAGATTLVVQPFIPITPAFGANNNMSIEDMLDNHPFYVGMSFRVADDNAAVYYKVIVTGIAIDNATNQIVLTIDNPITTASGPGGYQLNANDLLVVADNNLSFTINRAELVLEKLNVSSSGMTSMAYREYRTQENNGYANNQQYNDTFILEPECVNTVFTLHDNNDKLLSTPHPFTQINQYRLSVDNVDILKRPISVIDRLHADRIAVLFANMDLTLKSHFPYFNSLLSADPVTNSQDEVLVLGTPVPVKDTEKLLNVQISSIANPTINKLFLFKQLIRVINF